MEHYFFLSNKSFHFQNISQTSPRESTNLLFLTVRTMEQEFLNEFVGEMGAK